MGIRAPIELETAPDLACATGVGGRVASFHQDDRGQIIPLVMFLGIAFFTSVVLIINTGRAVTFKIENQNAVDAAVISGATNLARGMNYVASNNVTQARIIAVIIIMRAWKPAAETAAEVLQKVWLAIVIPAIHAAGTALSSNPFTAAIGAFLIGLATGLRIYVRTWEQTVVKVFIAATNAFKWFDKGIGVGIQSPGPKINASRDDKGVAWTLLKGLSKLCQLFAWWTPVIAQWSAQMMYQRNLSSAGGLGFVGMLPLFPTLPICQAKFTAFTGPVAKDAPGPKDDGYVDLMSRPVPFAVTFIVPLSLMPLWYVAFLEVRTKEMFGLNPPVKSAEDNELAKEIDRLSKEIKTKQDLLDPKKVEYAKIIGGEVKFRKSVYDKAKKGLKDGAGSDPESLEGVTGGAGTAAGKVPGINGQPNSTPGATDKDEGAERVEQARLAWVKAKTDFAAAGTTKPRKEELDPGTLKARRDELQAEKDKVAPKENQIAAAVLARDAIVPTDSPAALAAWTAANGTVTTLNNQLTAINNRIGVLKGQVKGLEQRAFTLRLEINSLENKIDKLQDKLDKKTSELMNSSGSADSAAPTDLDNVDFPSTNIHDDEIYPWLIDSADWPNSFTYLAIAGRGNRAPLGASDKGVANTWRVELFHNKMPVGVTYAAARLFAADTADTWTPNWTAKLVRVDIRTWPMGGPNNAPLRMFYGKLPAKCGGSEPAAGNSTTKDKAGGGGNEKGKEKAEGGFNKLDALNDVLMFFSRH